VPGAIIIEAMAQASIILFAALKPEIAAKRPHYFLGAAEAKFKKAVFPGDILTIEVTAVKILQTNGIIDAIARVSNEIAAKGTIGFGIREKV